MEMSEALVERVNLAARRLTREAGIASTFARRRNLEQTYAIAYRDCVRAGIRKPLRRKFRLP